MRPIQSILSGVAMGDDCHLDNGGRRCGWDRRKFCYTDYLPDRRCGEDRRSGDDRRKELRPDPAKNE